MTDPVSNTPPPGDLLARARAALEGVTPGPWKWDGFRVPSLEGRGGKPDVYEYDCFVLEAEHDGGCACRRSCELTLTIKDEDAQFIAAARELVPELADRLAELEQAVARVRGLAENPTTYSGTGVVAVKPERILRALDGTAP